MKAINEIGIKKSLRFILTTFFELFFSILMFPTFRIFVLRLFGATIGRDSVIHEIKFMNLYRGSFKKLTIGNSCFIGRDVILDLAGSITIGNSVTIADRCLLVTHLNVGYHDHPLQKYFPSHVGQIDIKNGVFIGVNSVILDNITIGEGVFVGAGSVVTKNVSPWTVAGGVPAKVIKVLRVLN